MDALWNRPHRGRKRSKLREKTQKRLSPCETGDFESKYRSLLEENEVFCGLAREDFFNEDVESLGEVQAVTEDAVEFLAD